ncbi:serine protease, partial [Amycolatopsis sp. H20-H5]|nr:serine protease [Amycolatopsis sp. H20-H5]
RLVLAFRRETSPGVSVIRSGAGARLPGEDDLDGRIGVLASNLAELVEIEQRHLHVTQRFADIAELPPRARRLRSALAQLRSAQSDGDPEWVKRHLSSCEHAVARALDRGRGRRGVLDQRMARRAELRARLEAYGEMAVHHGIVEDPELDNAYAHAWKLLFEGPCDVSAATYAVEHYARAVRKRIEGTEPG